MKKEGKRKANAVERERKNAQVGGKKSKIFRAGKHPSESRHTDNPTTTRHQTPERQNVLAPICHQKKSPPAPISLFVSSSSLLRSLLAEAI